MIQGSVSDATCPVEIDTLGSFEIRQRGEKVALRGRKTQALLAYLALAPSAKASRQRVADLLWGDRGEEQARASLRQSLSEARTCLNGSELLNITRSDIALRPAAFITDIGRIVDAADAADAAQLARCLDRVRGGLLDDLSDIARSFDEWILLERAHQHEIIVSRSLKVLTESPQLFSPVDLLTVLRALDRLDPANEVVTRLGMQADHAAGDIASIHRRYRRLDRILTTEFGTRPSAETRDLLHALTVTERPSIKAGQEDPAAPFHRSAANAGVGLPMIMVSPLAFSDDDQMGAEFADICSEDIRGRLTAYRDLRVVALETADLERVVGVCQGSLAAYLLSGRVRRIGTDLRIYLQIGHIGDTVIVWSETMTVPLTALTDAVSRVVGRAVGAVSPVIDRDLSLRLATTDVDDAECVVLYAKARAVVKEAGSLAQAQRGAALLQRVVDLDPRHVSARLLLAQLYNTDFWQQMAGHDVRAHRARALRLVTDAAKIEPGNLRVRLRLAWCHIRGGNWSAAERLLQTVTDAAPFDADAMNECGCAYYHLGELDAAKEAMQQAFALNPLPPCDYHGDYAIVEALRGQCEAAEEHFLVAGSGTLQYLAVRIANLESMQHKHRELPILVDAFRAAFLDAWRPARAATLDDVTEWVCYTMPMRRAEHMRHVNVGLISALGIGLQA